MRIRRIVAVGALGVAAALGIVGCSGADKMEAPGAQPQQAADSAGSGSSGNSGGTAGGSGEGAGESVVDEDSSAGAPNAQGGQQPVPAEQRRVVRTAQLAIEVDDVYAAAERAQDIGTRFGGYVADETTDDRSATIQLKVESEDLDAALDALAELGTKVTSRSQQAEDVTEQYVDLESRIATQRASVERVRALLANATAINEIVQVESELTSRQAELESLERRMAALSGQTQLATVSVRMHLAGDAPVADDDRSGFLGGLAAGWEAFVASMQVLLTMLGAVLPFLVALGVPLAVVLWVLRRRRPAAAPAPAVPPATPGS